MQDKKAKLLVIEDEADVRDSYIDMFSYFGFEVDAAPNGIEGVSMVKSNKYDIVITDLNMPEMDGLDVLRRVKKLEPLTEVIVITGYATLENAVQAMKVGAYDYFTKPIDMEHVRIVLTKCLQQLRAKQENKELRILNQRLSEINELKDKFITLTNHELRTPITVLKGYIELVDMMVSENRDEEIDDAFCVISQTIDELVRLVSNMHDFSKFERRKLAMSKSTFNFEDLLEEVTHELRLFFNKRGISLSVNRKAPAVIVEGDKERLKRTFRELLQNALKFTPEGGNVKITNDLNEDSQCVKIVIEDDGIGIPEDKQSLVFEPFYEVQDSINHTTSVSEFMGGGLGLGLTLVKEVIENHDGHILLESSTGSGSKFTVLLPYQQVLVNEAIGA